MARELHPGKAVVYGANAHYTHSRMCAVLGVEGDRGTGDVDGRIDMDAVEALCRDGRRRHGRGHRRARPGTGTVDDVARAVALRERYGVRVHVDAAYGGFFTLLDELVAGRASVPRDRRLPTASSSTRTSTACSPTAAARCCSATRASGGSTSTTRRTPTSPRGDLHLGEISLECSRAGAAAAALWLTLRSLDLAPILAAGVRAARAWAALLARLRRADACTSSRELDIVTYFPSARARVGDRRRERSACSTPGMTDRGPGLPEHAADRRAPRSPPRTRRSRWTPTACASCAAC